MRNILFTTFLFFLCYQIGFTKGIIRIEKTTIKVKLIDKDLDEKKVPKIKLQISSFPFGGIEFFKSKDLSYEQVAEIGGNVFNISSPAEIFYMYIYYEGQRIPGGSYYGIDNIYIIKAGSKLTVELDKQSVIFSGEGAILPNIQSEIVKYSYQTSESDLKLINNREYLYYFKKLDKSLDSTLELQLSVVEANKDVLGEYNTSLLKANCYGYRYYAQLRDYDLELMQNDVFFKKFQEYYRFKVNFIPKFKDEILNSSPIFANFIIEELNTLERIKHSEYGKMLPDSCFRNILQKINNNFNGILKDKLLTLFAFRTEKNENARPFFDEILGTVKNIKYNDLLVNKIKIKRNNVPFHDFNLEDETGKYYTLDSFKNQVVVIDFWFTGCENCIILNELMKPVIRHFNNNSKIKFVSISTDGSKSQWLKSIQIGNYTHAESLNLFTNGEGSAHDLIKHYNITSYPTVFVIKDGLMFSSLPPRPSRIIQPGQEFSEDGSRLIQLLEKAL